MMAIPEAILGGLLGGVSGLLSIFAGLKAKPHFLWYQSKPGDPKSWIKKAGPMSAHNCKGQRAELMKTGQYDVARFRVFRAGVDPNL